MSYKILILNNIKAFGPARLGPNFLPAIKDRGILSSTINDLICSGELSYSQDRIHLPPAGITLGKEEILETLANLARRETVPAAVKERARSVYRELRDLDSLEISEEFWAVFTALVEGAD
jgi:hypothetical protein